MFTLFFIKCCKYFHVFFVVKPFLVALSFSKCRVSFLHGCSIFLKSGIFVVRDEQPRFTLATSELDWTAGQTTNFPRSVAPTHRTRVNLLVMPR